MATNVTNFQPEGSQSKNVTIIVNGRPKQVDKGELTFEEVVALAFPNPPSSDATVFTVAYRKGEGNRPQGTLTPGRSVHVKEKMIFDVVATDKS
jgi:Multiubiquitin